MRASIGSRELSEGVRSCLLTTTIVVLVVGVLLVGVGPSLTGAWPAPRYECYCTNCYDGSFVCRNRDYSCNCAACSCYNDVHTADSHPTRDRDAYLEALMRHFYGLRRATSDSNRSHRRTG